MPKRGSELAIIASLLVAGTIQPILAQAEISTVRVGAASLLAHAREKALPLYPKESLKRNVQGVLVSKIVVGPDGVVRSVDIIQAPDPAIRDAMRAAFSAWKFENLPRSPSNQPALVEAKLFFYFVIENQRGLIFLPNELASHRGIRKGAPASVGVIDEPAWRQLAGKADAILVDVQRRDAFAANHLPGAVNIPEDEVWARTSELSRANQIVVDCPPRVAAICEVAAREFSKSGFANVRVLKRR